MISVLFSSAILLYNIQIFNKIFLKKDMLKCTLLYSCEYTYIYHKFFYLYILDFWIIYPK